MKSLHLTGLSILLMGASVALYGQEIRGSIVGNVTDASGAAVPGTRVTVRNEGTGIASATTTDASGTYTVPDLLAGMYTVIAVKEGFKAYQATGIRLLSSQTARQDIVLQVGAVVQTLEVFAHAQLVQTDSPTVGGTLQIHELTDLPYITTSTDSLMNLVPGMSIGISYGNSNPVIGGADYFGTSNFTVNGVTTNNFGQGGGGNIAYIGSAEMIAQSNLPSIGTLQEFKVDSSVVSAEYRSQTAISMVTKQGTNQYHGQLYEYNENKSLLANSFDLNKYNETQGAFNRNQFGGNIGGPILHDKFFFFANYDGIREVHPQAITANFPTQAMRQGDFSNLCDKWSAGLCTDTANGQQLYNPLTGQPFINNQIPPSMFAPQSKELAAFMPLPNVNLAPMTVGNSVVYAGSPFAPSSDYAGELPLRFGTNNAQLRLDGQLGSKDSVVVFGTMSKGSPWFYGYACCATYGSWTDHGFNWYNSSITETHTFGPGTVNEFRLGWLNAVSRSYGQNLGFKPWSLFPQIPVSPDRGLPTISMSGYGSTNVGGAMADVGNAHGDQRSIDIVDNLTWVRGRHTLKAGMDETGYKENDFCYWLCQPPLGNFGMSGQWTGNRGWNFGGNPQSAGNSFADFMLGYADSSGYQLGVNQRFYNREWDFYVQDTFKATPRLTLSYGVRYMYQTPWWFKDHNATFWDRENNKLVLQQSSSTLTVPPGANAAEIAAYPFETTGAIGAPLNYFNDDKDNWAPRVGFAYRPSSNNRTVIRGGWGVYYAFNAGWVGPIQSMMNIPWGASQSFSTQLPGNLTTAYMPDITFTNPFPAYLVQGAASNPGITVMDRNLINPVSQQWNLTVERQVAENWSFRASYLGDQGHHLTQYGANINKPAVMQPNVPNQLQAPYQPWSTITWTGYPGTSNFHQLQLEIQRRFANGLMFRTEYDWSRNLANVNGDSSFWTIQNPWDLRAEYSNTQWQYRHRFLTYYIYELPVGRGRKFLANMNKFEDAVLGGWRVSGITTYRSGDPLTPTFENPGTKIGWEAIRPDRVSSALYAGRQSGHDTVGGVQWFNPAAFAPPQPWHYGNASPWSIFGPGWSEWDVSVMKQFRLPKGESNKLEFKVDFFNVVNHYSLGDPSTGIADTRDGGQPDNTTGKVYGGSQFYQPRVVQVGLRLMF